MTNYEKRQAIKAEAKKVVVRIRELKAIRDEANQPRWRGSNAPLELEAAKGWATLLCLARARQRGRRHVVVLPRFLRLPARAGFAFGRCLVVGSQAELDALCDEEVRARLGFNLVTPVAEPTPVAA